MIIELEGALNLSSLWFASYTEQVISNRFSSIESADEENNAHFIQ